MTRCDTNGLVAEETANEENGVQLLDAEVKGRVPSSFVVAIDADVKQRRKQFPRASRSDVLRDALSEYFANNAPRVKRANGKAGAR